MRFTLTAAAKEVGVSKGTISKALKAGRLSGERQEDGSFQIEPVELFRVFPRNPQEPVPETAAQPKETAGEGLETAVELATLRVRVELMERERDVTAETVADLRRRLDRAEDRILALSAPQRPQDGPGAIAGAETPSQEPRGLLARLLGRG